jgi:N-ethylmaleimide reductase
MNTILSPYTKGKLQLKNRLVMAPMTRSRAVDNIPNELMAEYYGQRSGAGLIITEGTAPMPEGLGYPRIPGVFSAEQVAAWKKVTAAVHANGSQFFLQLMHTGRIGHPLNLPEGKEVVGASSIKAAGAIYTDKGGLQDYPVPMPLTTAGVMDVIRGHMVAAEHAIEAGFDGVELHGANGYLIEQFLNPNVNTRTDEYGGTIERRAKFAVEMAKRVAESIGKEKVGIRFSPYNSFGDMQPYTEAEVFETYHYLAQEMEKIGIAYLHIAVSAQVPPKTLDAIRTVFTGTIIHCNGFTPETAEAALNNGVADLVAFGKAYLANPDLDKRIAGKQSLNKPDPATLYTSGAKGYVDYPVHTENELSFV